MQIISNFCWVLEADLTGTYKLEIIESAKDLKQLRHFFAIAAELLEKHQSQLSHSPQTNSYI